MRNYQWNRRTAFQYHLIGSLHCITSFERQEQARSSWLELEYDWPLVYIHSNIIIYDLQRKTISNSF